MTITRQALLKASVLSLMLMTGFSIAQSPCLYAAPKAQAQTPAESQQTQIVNVNKAGLDELQTVRGIGPVIAERIMQYRNEHGRFEKVEDLANVHGIGEAKFQKIKNQVSI